MSMAPFALISELLMFEQGKYIVKVSVCSDSSTLATGLAGAFTVEEAEDQARQRAMDAINLSTNFSPSEIQAIQPATKPKVSEPAITEDKPVSIAKSAAQETPSSSEPKKSNTSAKRKPKETKSVKPTAEVKPAEPAETFEATANGKKTSPLDVVDNSISSTENVLPLQEESTTQQSLADVAESTTSLNDTPEVVAENQSPAQNTEEINETMMDFSQIIDQTSIELKRLGWTQEDGKKYLLSTYGKKSRHLLSDEELIEFLRYLKQQ